MWLPTDFHRISLCWKEREEREKKFRWIDVGSLNKFKLILKKYYRDNIITSVNFHVNSTSRFFCNNFRVQLVTLFKYYHTRNIKSCPLIFLRIRRQSLAGLWSCSPRMTRSFLFVNPGRALWLGATRSVIFVDPHTGGWDVSANSPYRVCWLTLWLPTASRDRLRIS